MGKICFSLKRKLKSICQCVSRRRRVLPGVNCPLFSASRAVTTRNPRSDTKPISKLIKWTQKIGSKAKAICCGSGHGRYVKMGEVQERPVKVRKGYMSMYVGSVEDGEFQRVYVPVVHINHPLFLQLLQASEEVFGLNYKRPLTIPCPLSEFEHIQTRIKKETRKSSFGTRFVKF